MFESPVTLIESKKQKTVFEDVDGSKVVAYLEKDSPGTLEPELFLGEGLGVKKEKITKGRKADRASKTTPSPLPTLPPPPLPTLHPPLFPPYPLPPFPP